MTAALGTTQEEINIYVALLVYGHNCDFMPYRLKICFRLTMTAEGWMQLNK
jgi:hypothetical protein